MDTPSVYLKLTDDQQEWYEERAAILEYEAGLRRHLAEAEALRGLRGRIRAKFECIANTKDAALTQ